MYNEYYLNKIVLVTGGGSGIGRGLTAKLAEAGAIVICTDIDLAKADDTVSGIANGKAVSKKLDVSELPEFQKVIAEAITHYGKLDLFFNNAGIAVSGEIRDITVADWKKIMDVNFFGVLHGSQLAYQYMSKQGSGQIVNIASAAGLINYLALMAPYSVTKHAVVNYTEILRVEAKELGIKANVVCPGFISTSIGINSMAPNAAKAWNDLANRMVENGINVDKAVDLILKGVERNKGVIIFPFNVRIMVLFSRLFGGIVRMIMHKQIKEFRTNYRINN